MRFVIWSLDVKGIKLSRSREARGVGGDEGNFLNIWHSMDVRAEWLPFSALPGI